MRVGEGWSRRGMVGGLAALASPLGAAAQPARLPLSVFAGKLWVPVVVNGVGAEAILDTGASRTSIDRAFAAAAGIQTHGRFTGQMIQGRVAGAYARDVVVRIGEALVRAEGAVAVDYSQLSGELAAPSKWCSVASCSNPSSSISMSMAPKRASSPARGSRRRPARGRSRSALSAGG
ncbi:MAG: Aspartyl protease [Caulobacteraceae bacterium]|nr:Aspartyl protease [Caulobacteraceae bacterium]